MIGAFNSNVKRIVKFSVTVEFFLESKILEAFKGAFKYYIINRVVRWGRPNDYVIT